MAGGNVMNLDLNCDLGEGEPFTKTRSLMRWITSANIACGGHAGDVATMRACLRTARSLGVKVGAHPGAVTRDGFGRGRLQILPDELELLLFQQVGTLSQLAAQEGVRLHHIKLHGSLYHAVEGSRALAACYIRVTRQTWPRCILYGRAGGLVARMARRAKVQVWEEVFIDRAYHDDGTLVAREEPGALLLPEESLERARRLRQSRAKEIRVIESRTGGLLRLRARTLCLHADTPGAIQLAKALAQILGDSANG
jgi:UPF0271 protein